jgi:GNAT superfamily N-acetyltransferase
MSEPRLEAEQIELAVMQDLFAHVEPARAEKLGIHAESFGGAVAFSALACESILFNRVLGFGLFSSATQSELDAIAAHYAKRNVSNYLVHVHPDAQPPELLTWLAERGYVPFRRAWAKFVREAEPVAMPESTLRTERIDSDHGEAFVKIVTEAYALKPEAKTLLNLLPRRPGFSAYTCFVEDEPAAVAAMYTRDDVAWFGFAATRRPFRGRGAQQSLLRRRIEDALAAGCTRFYAETGEPADGEPQHSYHNIQRAGFRRIYVRDNYILSNPK